MKHSAIFAALLVIGMAAAESVRGQVLDYSQLVSLWRLTGDSADSYGTNNGVMVGDAVFDAGPLTEMGSAVFAGTNYVKAGKGIAFETNIAFTATAWIKGPAQNSAIMGRMDQGGSYTGWEFHVGDRAGLLNVWLINQFGPNYIAVYGGTPILDESWHHVAFTYDGSSKAAGVKIYVDGQDSTGEATADNLSATILAEDAELNLGSRQNGSAHFYQGSISEASVWETVLTPGNIAYLHKTGIPVTLPTPDIRLSGFRFTPPTTFSFAWVSVVGKSYRVETSSNLKDWSATADNYPTGGATSTSTTFSEAAASNAAVFYRVLQR